MQEKEQSQYNDIMAFLKPANVDDMEQERREREERKREEKLGKFQSELASVLREHVSMDGHKGLGIGSYHYYEPKTYNLTAEFKKELKDTVQEELRRFELDQARKRPPNTDKFGIKRRFCEFCKENCIGYENSKQHFPPKLQVEFPTFCIHCHCPAYFHTVCNEDQKFPDDYATLLTGQNIQQTDLNFNSILAVFMIKNKERQIENITELSHLFSQAGIEAVSMQSRHLDMKEAIYLQSRIVKGIQTLHTGSDDFNPDRGSIKHMTAGQYLLDELSEVNPYLVSGITNHREQKLIQSMAKSTPNDPQQAIGNDTPVAKEPSGYSPPKESRKAPSNPQGSPKNIQIQTDNAEVSLLSPVREVAESVFSDDLERDIGPFEQTDHQQMAEINRVGRKSLMPRKTTSWFIFGKHANTNSRTQKKKRIIDTEFSQDKQLEYLMNRIEKDPFLHDLVRHEMVLTVLNSTQLQNLRKIIETTLKSSVISAQELPLIYTSTNKIYGIEDCITFCPQLFKINKSIIISEPLISFNKFLADKSGGEIMRAERKQGFELRKKVKELKQKIAKEFQPDSKAKSAIKQPDETPGWLRRIKEREHFAKTNNLYSQNSFEIRKKDPTAYNFGVMHDFINYSGISIQHCITSVDLKHPPFPSGIRGGDETNINYAQLPSHQCNIFQIAKVGLSNLLFPSTLDAKISNFENTESVIQIQDLFFPEFGKVQTTVIVFRPIVVRNEINELFVRILRLNNFVILKRKIRMLTKHEIEYLLQQEKIGISNAELYYNNMSSGPCEFVVVSKIGAVAEAKTLMSGASPFGRRRVNQLQENQQVRMGMHAVDSLFEISPFTSFGELFDLEDFLIRNSKIKKFKQLADYNRNAMNAIISTYDKEKAAKQVRTAENLFTHKMQEIRQEIDYLVRNFNLAGYASQTLEEAERDICVFAPQIAEIEEVILILNPMYNHVIEDAFELLLRCNFSILAHSFVQMDEKNVKDLFKAKYGDEYDEFDQLYTRLGNSNIHIFHLTKPAADRECRERYLQSELAFKDLTNDHEYTLPLQPHDLPYLFFFQDLESTFEAALGLLYDPKLLDFTGNTFVNMYDSQEALKIIQTCLMTTVGDKVKFIAINIKGNIEVTTSDDFHKRDNFLPINVITNSVQGFEHCSLEPLFLLQQSTQADSSRAIVYTVEAENGGLYDVKFHRLASHGDMSKYECSVTAKDEARRLHQQFTSLDFYYKEVNKTTYNICPVVYRFRIQPFETVVEEGRGENKIHRVFEVEEHMGGHFIEELAQMEYDHVKVIEHAKQQMNPNSLFDKKQRSLPSYLQGSKMAEMCKKLEEIKCHTGISVIKGGGNIIYDPAIKYLRGELAKITEKSYYRFDRERYLKCLDNFKHGWDYYLSVLESRIIELKLMTILDSLTFRYSRMPQFLRVFPERLTTQNLKISKRIKVNQGSLKDATSIQILKKFDITNKERTDLDVSAYVISSLKSVIEQNLKQRVNSELRRKGTTLEVEVAMKNNKESPMLQIVKEVSISGFEGIARRPKYHLAANLLWLVDFSWRKLERRAECFLGDRRATKEMMELVEYEYDEILDTIKDSFCKNYADSNLGLDVLGLQSSMETDYEKHVRIKQEENAKRLAAAQELIDEEKRKKRNHPQMTINELLQTEVYEAIDKENQRQREELRRMLDRNRNQDIDGQKFMQHLEQTKIKFGPYALKVAEEYVRKQTLENQRKATQGKRGAQEKISFVKMEYFLRGVVEADTIILRLKHMEKRINAMLDEQDELGDKVNRIRNETQRSQQSRQTSGQTSELKQQERLQKAIEEYAAKEKEVMDFRYQVSMKETELLLVFRELEACDFWIPDHEFEAQINPNLGKKPEQYLVPMETFWRPVVVEGETEPDIYKEKWMKHVNAMPDLTEDKFGVFLAAPIRETLLAKDKELLFKRQRGGTEPGLWEAHRTEFAKTLVMDKYASRAEAKSFHLFEEQKKKMAQQNAKTVHEGTLLKDFY